MTALFQEKAAPETSPASRNGASGDSSDEMTAADKALAEMGYVPVSLGG
jgi:hypothetical protein